MRKYIASILTVLVTLLLIASINQIPRTLYGGNATPTISGLEGILGIQNGSGEYQGSPVNGSKTTSKNIEASQLYPWLPMENMSGNRNGTNSEMPNSASNGTPALNMRRSIDLRKNGYCKGDRKTVVMTVEGAAHTAYLRNAVYTKYLDGKWYAFNETPVPGNRGTLPFPKVKHSTVSDSITVTLSVPIVSSTLFTALYTAEVNASIPTSYYNESHLFGADGIVWKYSLHTTHYQFQEEVLEAAVSPRDDIYLQVPNLSLRVVQLAENITRGIEGDYRKARAIETYLKTHYKYDENAPPAPEGIDPVEWFLFHSRRGVCIDFNTAFVILARLSGIPARLVTGYMVRKTPDEQAVHPKQAHAWAEVPFKGLGWVTFDATASGSSSALEGSHSPPNVTGGGRGSIPEFSIQIKPDPVITGVNRSFFVNITVIPRRIPEVEGCSPEFRATVDMNGLYKLAAKLHPNTSKRLLMKGLPEPGTYHPTVTVALMYCGEVNLTRKTSFTVIVKGTNFSLVAKPSNLTLAEGELGRLKIFVSGKNYLDTVYLHVEYPFKYRLLRDSGIPDFSADLLVVAPEETGDYTIKIIGNSGNVTNVLHVPLRVMGVTRTAVTGYPDRIIKDTPFWVNGTVTDRHGNPVDGPVYVTLNESKDSPGTVVGNGTSKDGRFNIKCTLPSDFSPGEYQVVAHFVGNEYYLPSNSDPGVTVVDRTSIEVPRSMIVNVGTVQLGGTLVDSSGRGIENVTVGVILDGTRVSNVTTDAEGVFTSAFAIESPGEHRVVLAYPGNKYYLGTVAEINLTAVKLDVEMPKQWVIGRNVTVNGSVLGVSSGEMRMSTPAGLFETNLSGGVFRFDVPVNASPGAYNVFFTYEDAPLETVPVVVTSPTNIIVQFDELREGENATVRVMLMDVFGNPLSGKNITLQLFGVHMGKTGGNGTAVFSVVPDRSGKVHGTAVFGGESFYLPSQTSFTVSVGKKHNYFLLALPLLFIPVGVFIYKKRVGGGFALKLRPITKKLEERGYTLSLSLDRSPPVYGEGEQITVLAPAPVELYVDGEPAGTGREFRLALPKGVHELLARGDGGKGRARVWVVDYREEIMRLYDRCFLDLARRHGLGGRDLAPEELAHRLKEEYDWNNLKTVTYLFEVARYSLYPVGLNEFLEFYRALSRLVGGGCYGEES